MAKKLQMQYGKSYISRRALISVLLNEREVHEKILGVSVQFLGCSVLIWELKCCPKITSSTVLDDCGNSCPSAMLR